MLRFNDHKQQQIFDPWSHISPKRRRMLDHSWPGLFKQHILPKLPLREFAAFFDPRFGRPTKDLSTVLGLLILQQTLDLDDEEAIEQLAFNMQLHYALDIIEESDEAKYICPKTLWSMRRIAVENGLESILFRAGTQSLATVFNVDSEKQRIDSVHIQSNMRRLGRISIFSTAIHKFLKNLKRHHGDLFQTVEPQLIERYLSEKALSCFAMVKPSQSHKSLQQVSADLYGLIRQFDKNDDVRSMHSFKLLQRVLNEQCQVQSSGEDCPVKVKEPKQIPSDSLQNPSDPDASYSGHKGQGYQVQIMETYTDTDDKDEKAGTLNLITHVEVQRAHESDAKALIPAIDSAQQENRGPKQLLADSLYGSDENIEAAELKGVEVVAPPMGKEKESTIGLSDFHLEKSGKIINCPQGNAPIKIKKKKTRYSAAFYPTDCSSCPNQGICPVKPGKQGFYLYFSEKQLRIALRRSAVDTEAFKDRYRWRAGVEATMSEFDRRTGVKRLRVRGLKAVRFYAIIKALGLNILRAAAVVAAILAGDPDKSGSNGSHLGHKSIFKELIYAASVLFANWLCRSSGVMNICSKPCFR
jgi:hypothetical protein